MTAQQKGRQGRGRPYCNNLILRSLIVSCCSCLPGSVCGAYVKHISPLSPGVRRCGTKTAAPRARLSDDTHTRGRALNGRPSAAFSPHSLRPQRLSSVLKGSGMPFPAVLGKVTLCYNIALLQKKATKCVTFLLFLKRNALHYFCATFCLVGWARSFIFNNKKPKRYIFIICEDSFTPQVK